MSPHPDTGAPQVKALVQCTAGSMAGQPVPAEGVRSFPDAESQAAMVRSLGVRSDRGANLGELVSIDSPCHIIDLSIVQAGLHKNAATSLFG